MKFLLTICFIAIFFNQLVFAEEVTNLYLVAYGGESDARTCELVQPEADVLGTKKKPKRYQGIRTDDACHVVIKASDFEKEYDFCFLSGVNVTGSGSAKDFNCNVSHNKGMWSFEGWITNLNEKYPVPRSIGCSFICIKE